MDSTIRSDHPRNDQRGRRYLQGTVGTASPAKLRLMLIERAAEIAGGLAVNWSDGPSTEASQTSLRLLEILTELLDGITGQGDLELNRRVADLYVFLIQHLLAAENAADAATAREIETVLRIEAETWRAVCAREGAASQGAASQGGAVVDHPAGSLNLQA